VIGRETGLSHFWEVSLMFRLFRLPILLLVAFITGIWFERAQQRELCEAAGGEWFRGGACEVSE